MYVDQESIEAPSFVMPGDGSHGGPNRGAEQDVDPCLHDEGF